MKKMKLNSKAIILTLVITLLIPIGAMGSNPTGNIIVTPQVLEGEVGSQIQVDKALLVQEVTMTNVKLLDVVIMADNKKIVTRYPNKEDKYSVVEKSTNRKLGFVTLKPSTTDSEVSISFNLQGEFPYYQEGSVFNTLRNAKEGPIYFYRKVENKSQPLILDIGEIKNGTYLPKDFIEIKSKVIQIKESLK